mgnify:CR=1 FL=1
MCFRDLTGGTPRRDRDGPVVSPSMTLHSITRSTVETSTGPPSDCYVLGDGTLADAVARRLTAAGHAVTLVGVDAADGAKIRSLPGDPSSIDVLRDAGLSEQSAVVVATQDDGRNLLLAQLVRTRFGVCDVFVVVHGPDRSGVVADAGHEPICATSVLADAVVDDVRLRLTEGDGA